MRLKAMGVEVGWLIGCYIIAFLLLGALLGYPAFLHNPLDIQLHNTYVVISNTQATLPLFLVVALVVSGARAVAKPLRTRYTWVVLLVLGVLLLLSALLIVLISKR